MRSGFRRTDGRSSTARGYGSDWRKVRLLHLAGEPLCRMCAEQGRVTAATDVDHIKAFEGLGDPLRLDRGNLRSLCRPCHMQRTARQASGREIARIGVDGWPVA
jgi:5-methylcytosine-specific restriction protein A